MTARNFLSLLDFPLLRYSLLVTRYFVTLFSIIPFDFNFNVAARQRVAKNSYWPCVFICLNCANLRLVFTIEEFQSWKWIDYSDRKSRPFGNLHALFGGKLVFWQQTMHICLVTTREIYFSTQFVFNSFLYFGFPFHSTTCNLKSIVHIHDVKHLQGRGQRGTHRGGTSFTLSCR